MGSCGGRHSCIPAYGDNQYIDPTHPCRHCGGHGTTEKIVEKVGWFGKIKKEKQYQKCMWCKGSGKY
mgnify:CR=1 FL=1